MNKKNLLRMADHIETVPQKKFDMMVFRDDDSCDEIECRSVGCVIGHCTALDSIENVPFTHYGDIQFVAWSERFTWLNVTSAEWKWCFDEDWSEVDNTPVGAAKRIRWLVNNGLPKNWEYQMMGREAVCYMEKHEKTKEE